ncbi:PGF-CTERM protein [Haloplanus vescus]|uniref:PGF-CTERM protein n=1 Tax=Haloplanus vescus TaxID=555874 RepID=A0A1H3WLT4_9EURY|nr:PGF-CTERM sorting domain-containing protein [Haloplanus vescus]SDZ87771.1 PGF-CTERM protein [Haloplanus vescus]
MQRNQRSLRKIGTVVGVVFLALAVLSGSTLAVSGLSVTSLTNAEVESGQTTTHTLEYQADGISADGTTDVLFVRFPDTYAGNISVSGAEFVNRTSGATVSVSSSTSIVDGPDGDGVQETLRTGISNDADYDTDDIRATYEFSLTHPTVEEDTSYDVTVIAQDSSTSEARTTATDAITVVAGSTSSTATATSTSTATATSTSTSTATATTTATSESTATPTESSMDEGTATPTESSMGEDTATPTETSGSGPGFGTVTALLAVVAVTLLLRRD